MQSFQKKKKFAPFGMDSNSASSEEATMCTPQTIDCHGYTRTSCLHKGAGGSYNALGITDLAGADQNCGGGR